MKVKICCIKSVKEAMTAIRHGATALGLVGPMPSGPGPIGLDLISRISADIPAHIDSFYLTSKTSFDDIVSEYELAQTSHIQLTDHVEESVRIKLKNTYPELKIVQVIHVQDGSSIDQAMSYAESSDALLLDSGSPTNSLKTLGGTGKTHDWRISAEIVRSLSIPVYLAGGLKASNVLEAVERVQPHGIDLCSSVRTNDIMDEHKIARFFKVLRENDLLNKTFA